MVVIQLYKLTQLSVDSFYLLNIIKLPKITKIMKSEMRVLLLLLGLFQMVTGDKKFVWKMIKSNEHERLTEYGTVKVCGVAKGVEPCKFKFCKTP